MNRGYALFVALLPVLMMYKAPVIGLGISTTMIIAGFFFAVLVILADVSKNGGKLRIAKVTVPFMAYLLYETVKSTGDINHAIQTLLLIFHIMAIATGPISVKYLKKYIISTAVLAASLVMVQTLFHQSLAVHVPLIAPGLCLDDLSYYRTWILSGYPPVENLYRPSAFFLEPSHLAHYCFVAMSCCLLAEKPRLGPALVISAGVIFSTSGMGIALMGIIWCWYGLRLALSFNWPKKVVQALVLGGLVVIVTVAVPMVPFFQGVLARILSPVEYSADSYNAIWGRILYWDTYISPLHGRELWFGLGYENLPDDYFTGLMELIYCSGIIGAILFFLSLIPFLCAKNTTVVCIAALAGGLMIMANLNGFITLIYMYGSMIAILTGEGESADERIQ